MIASTCDHFTRVSTGGSKLPANAPVYGLLFGTRADGACSVCDSVDINYTFDNNEIHILPGEIDNKAKLWTAVFTTYKLIGWYSFGVEVNVDHRKFHDMISGYAPDPVFLLINQSALSDSDELPLCIYISDNGNNSPTGFKNAPFFIETSEVEKLALDHITKSTPVPGLSSLEVKNQSTLTSLRILDNKVDTIIETLQAMQDGRVPMNHALLRQAAKICQSLPPVDGLALREGVTEEVTNSLLITYLSTATHTAGQLEKVADVYNGLYSDRGMSHI